MRSRAWPFLLLALSLLIGTAAAEGAQRPPRAELRANGSAAKLSPWTYTWNHPSGAACASMHADGIPDYRPRLAVAHRHARPQVVFLRDRRPRVTRFRAYRRISRSGLPAGRGQRVASTVRPRRRDGEVTGWRVKFRVDVVARPYFDLHVSFRPRGRCSEGGAASYAFGIERG